MGGKGSGTHVRIRRDKPPSTAIDDFFKGYKSTRSKIREYCKGCKHTKGQHNASYRVGDPNHRSSCKLCDCKEYIR